MFKPSILVFLIASGLWSGCKKHADERDPYIGDYYGYVVQRSWNGSVLLYDTTYVKVSVNKNKEYPYVNVNYPGASFGFSVHGDSFQKPPGATNNMTLGISSGGDLDMLYHPGGHAPSYTQVIAHR